MIDSSVFGARLGCGPVAGLHELDANAEGFEFQRQNALRLSRMPAGIAQTVL